jgi:HK97 family phage major capsid protein
MLKNNMDNLKKLREDRVEKEEALSALVKEAETKTLSAEQKTKFNELEAEIKQIDEDIVFEEKIEARRKEAAKKKINTENRAVGAPQDDVSEVKEMNKLGKRYSFAKAFQNVLSRKNHDGVEQELFEEAKKEIAESGEDLGLMGNISIPSKFMKIGKRKLLDVDTEGTDSVFSEYAGLIPILNPIPKVTTLGITVMPGLRGNPKMVRETGDVAFAWETENADVNETTPTLDSIDLSPKRVGGYVDVSVQFLKQNIFIVEPWLRGKLENRYALTVDDAVIDGAGSGNEPTGIFNYNGVNVLSLGSGASTNNMTYPALLSMIRSVKTAKSREGSSGWLTNANGAFALYNTPRQASGVEGNFILNPDSPNLIGRRFVTSENVSSAFSEGSESDLVGIIYSDNWQSAILGTWGGLDILFDPYTQALGGKIRFVCNAFMDVEIEHAAEFSICKDWDATDAPALT